MNQQAELNKSREIKAVLHQKPSENFHQANILPDGGRTDMGTKRSGDERVKTYCIFEGSRGKYITTRY